MHHDTITVPTLYHDGCNKARLERIIFLSGCLPAFMLA
jgi:hypothetical protein